MTWQDGCCDKHTALPTAPWSLGCIYDIQRRHREYRLERISREEDEEDERGTKKKNRQVGKEEMIKVRRKEQACSLKPSWHADVDVTRAYKQPLQYILILNPSALLNHACAWRPMNIHDATKAMKTWRAKKKKKKKKRWFDMQIHVITKDEYHLIDSNCMRLMCVRSRTVRSPLKPGFTLAQQIR